MRKMKLLIVLLLAYSGMKAQNTALQFDGMDDYAIVTMHNQPNTISAQSFTFEAIVSPQPQSVDMVVLESHSSGNSLTFGILSTMELFIEYNNVTYIAHDGFLSPNECQHVAFSLHDGKFHFYIQGSLYYSIPAPVSVVFGNGGQMVLGRKFTPSNYFRGIIDEIRIWPEARSSNDISTYQFTTPTIGNWSTYLLLPFWEGSGTKSYDPLSLQTNYAEWFPTEGANISWVPTCMTFDSGASYKVGTTPLPPCILSGNPLEMICNGGFEQFDPILFNPPSWASRFHPLSGFNFSGTDVVNWCNTSQAAYGIGYPLFFVREDGVLPMSIGGIPQHELGPNHPAPNTWNAPISNNAMVGVYSISQGMQPYLEHGLKTQLNYPAISGQSYQFEAYTYTTRGAIGYGYPNWTHDLELVLRSSTVPSAIYIVPKYTLTNAINLNSTNGWEHVQFNFTIPNSLGTFDILEVFVRVNSFLLPEGAGVFSYIDDLSLIPIPTNFPQAINLFNDDPTHRRMHVDFEDNVYVAGNINTQNNNGAQAVFGIPVLQTVNTPISKAFYVAKYNAEGELKWTKIYTHMQIGNFDFDASGDIIYTGYYIPPSSTTAANPGNITFSTLSTPFHWGSENLVIGKISRLDGSQVFLQGYGGLGIERGLDITVNKNTNNAYIAADLMLNSSNNQMGSFIWGGNVISNNAIIYGQLAPTIFFQGGNNSNFGSNNLTRIGMHNNNGIYLLSNEEIFNLDFNLNVLSSIQTDYDPANSNTIPKGFCVGKNGFVYITYPLTNPSRLVRYDQNLSPMGENFYNGYNQGGFQSFPYYYPLAVADMSNGDLFVSGLITDQVNSVNVTNYFVQKYSFDHDEIWLNQTVGNNCNVMGYSISDNKFVNTDLEAFNSSAKLAFIGIFEPYGSPWSLQFDNKFLSCTQTPPTVNQYAFVGTIDDFGTKAEFKNLAETTSFEDEVKVFPNPFRGNLHIISQLEILGYELYTTDGKIVTSRKVSPCYQLEMNHELPNGLYLLKINTASKIVTKKVLIHE